MLEKRKQALNPVRQLVLVFGDQLDRDSSAFDSFDQRLDHVLLIESAGEATNVWTHKQRIAIFISAIRQPYHEPKGEPP